MKRALLLASALLVLAASPVAAQINGDVIGIHDLSPGSRSPITGGRPGSCSYCHAPHNGLATGVALWNQTQTKATYQLYNSSTYHQRGQQPVLGSDSNLCLSCHDGTVAVGNTIVSGQITMYGAMNPQDVFGTNLQSSHPFSLQLPIKDTIDLVASLAAQGKTGDPTGAVHLVNGNIECTSCHNPHVQAIDLLSQNFLVRDSSKAQMCLACHDPNRTLSNQVNPLAGWGTSAHNLATNKVSTGAGLGSYGTVAANACISCHTPHNALGPARLLHGLNEQDCIACHGGGTNLTPAIANVFTEFSKVGHPFPAGNNTHDAAENTLLNNNRHATCVDCHSGHASQAVTTFTIPPAVRVSQAGIAGISASDGTTIVNPSVNQYENCLRCHGTSTGKVSNPIYGYLPLRVVSAGDPLNVIPQFAATASSSHPVTHGRSSPLPQPSLLQTMLDERGGTTNGRVMGSQIFCTDCHNSDDNREFGGTGPNGPHGSAHTHILERDYEFSQAATPGGLITNLFPNPDLTVHGPYAMCGKCHDLSNVVSNASWNQHGSHINTGFSCSVCHTAHGMGARNGTISGERLVNFDINVVAQNSGTPVSYSRATNTCTLVCHNTAHNADGSVTQYSLKNKKSGVTVPGKH
ncbi:MAG: cytochrome c3 family protein [Candidatus Korobacteraceae bacterium]